jgi:Holliday junction resolvasome RuvABC endonuclease subunit
VQVATIGYSHLDSQVVEDFTHTAPASGNLFVNRDVTSSVVIPQNHGVILMMSYSRTGIAVSPIISTYLEFEKE